MAAVLDINNIVNVQIQRVPAGLGEVNVNNLLLLTTETPSNIDAFRNYTNALQVATDYGTDSETYNLANVVFAQSPSILSGNGRLVIAPLQDAVSATPGDWVTADISANLAALIAVTNGDLQVVLSGTTINLTGLNFTGCVTLADIATVIQRKLTDVILSADATTITFTSKTVGQDSTVVVRALSGGLGTNLAGAGLINTDAGVETDGEDSSGETIVEALVRLADTEAQFVPFFTNLLIEDEVALTTSTAVQALNNIWFHSWASTEDLAGIITDINSAGNYKTRCLLYTLSLEDAVDFRAAYASAACSVNFNGSNTFSTMQLRTLNGLAVDNGITQSIYDKCHLVGADTYDNFGIPAVTTTRYQTTGLYFDQVYGQQWLIFVLQINVFNVLKTSVVGVRQTQQGVDSIIAGINSVMTRAVTVGYIGTGLRWNSSYFFGNQQNLINSIFSAGYYIYAAPITSQTQEQREAREAPPFQIAYKEAGFFNTASVLGFVEA